MTPRLRPSWKVLLGLLLAVLLAHTLLLRALPYARVWLEPASSGPTPTVLRSFVTRQLTLPLSEAQAQEPPLPVVDPPPKPKPRPKPLRPATSAHKLSDPAPRPPAPASPAAADAGIDDGAAETPGNHEIDSAHVNTDAAILLVSDSNTAARTPTRDSTARARSTNTAAVHVPASQRLAYTVSGEIKHIPYVAQAELLWRNLGANYSARLAINALFLISRVQTSVGQITAQGLAPDRFGDKVRSEVAAHFERDKGIISFSANTPDQPLQPLAQDRLSVLLQLSSLLAGAPAHYPAGSVISLQTVGPRSADEWRFVVQAPETLMLPAGRHPTLKLHREELKDYDLGVDVWLASDLAWLPVQLRLTQSNGDFVQLQLNSVEKPGEEGK